MELKITILRIELDADRVMGFHACFKWISVGVKLCSRDVFVLGGNLSISLWTEMRICILYCGLGKPK